jgi:hypothetical protein
MTTLAMSSYVAASDTINFSLAFRSVVPRRVSSSEAMARFLTGAASGLVAHVGPQPKPLRLQEKHVALEKAF